MLIVSMLFVGVQSISADESKALSTSRFVEISYKNNEGLTVHPCSGKKALFGQTYVSIAIDKLTLNKDDNIVQRMVNRERRVFPMANLKAEYKSQNLSISKVGKPVALYGSNSNVDMGIEWIMVDRIPWVVKNASFEIRLGYLANSTNEAIVEAFNGITTAIPEYTLSTSLITGFAITSAIDKLLFASDRSIDLLRANRDLPLLAGQLCEGYYAIFSAENNSAYEKYYDGSVLWTGSDLQYKGKPINDVSYAVISVKVSDRYYPNTAAAFNDTSRPWTNKYRDVLTSLYDLIWVGEPDEVQDKEKSIRNNLIEARTLLNADLDLTQQEKKEIHEYAQNEAIVALNAVKTRLASNNKVTMASTQDAIQAALSNKSSLLDEMTVTNARKILANPTGNIPPISSDLGVKLNTSIKSLEKAIQFQ